MNCKEFERVIIELASEQWLNEGLGEGLAAGVRQAALAHAADCARCAARFERELRLSAQLNAVAADETRVKAPSHLRKAVRAAFDAEVAPAASAPIPLPPAAAGARSGWLFWSWVGVAAVFLFVVTVVLLQRAGSNAGSYGSGPEAAATPTPRPKVKPPEIKRGDGIEPARDDLAALPALNQRAPQRLPVRRPAREADEDEADFIPLTLVAQAEPAEIKQIVRVEVARSTLMMWGLPMNAERSAELVLADVMVGEDGVPRAIRIRN